MSDEGRKFISNRISSHPLAMLRTSAIFNDFNSAAVKLDIGSEKSVDPNRLRDFIFCTLDIAKVQNRKSKKKARPLGIGAPGRNEERVGKVMKVKDGAG